MKLMDKEAFKASLIGKRYGTAAIFYHLDNAPEIDAIPIEWLKEFFANIEYEMRMNKEKITSDKIDDLVEYMIAKWSEEKGNWENG